MKRIIVLLVILLSVSNVSAWDGNGNAEYPNTGYTSCSSSHEDGSGAADMDYTGYYDTQGNSVYYYFYGYGSVSPGYVARGYYCFSATETLLYNAHQAGAHTASGSTDFTSSINHRIKTVANTLAVGQTSNAAMTMYVSPNEIIKYNVIGNTCGVTSVKLYIGTTLLDVKTLNNNVDSYSFDILDNIDYKLIFSDAHEYEFTCDGNEIYDRDLCSYFTINLLDNCANLLIYPSVDIYKCADIPAQTELIYQGSDSSINLLLGTDCNISDQIDIYIATCDGTVHKIIYADETSDNIFHNSISWNLDVHVIDDNTSANINQAKVYCTQDCSIDEPNTKNQLTQTNGHTIFTGLSNSDMTINVEKSGYGIYSQTLNVGNAFNCWSDGGEFTVYLNASTNGSDNWNNGTHNDTNNTDGEGGELLPDDNSYGCGVYFKNTAGIITNTINDTDAYVDMYYWVKMDNCTTASLKFQSQIYTYWYTDMSYTVDNNTYEYRRILNSNFSDHTNSYRGYIFNSTCGCNDIQILHVINQSYEEETHYENLTSHCWIKNKLSGNEIDYRSDIKCVIYANSTNSTLLNITANFMNGSTLVDSISLNWADFVTGSPKWYYTWYPDYEYTSGYNYTLNITGFNDYQLDTDEVWTADIIGNTLTVYVKDNHNEGVPYATVFIAGWGSQATGASTYVTISGLPDGDTQYKATKSGYTSSVWDTITLAGADESTICVLVKESMASVTGFKMKDNEIKAFFIPLIYLLLILIIIGGVTNASK